MTELKKTAESLIHLTLVCAICTDFHPDEVPNAVEQILSELKGLGIELGRFDQRFGTFLSAEPPRFGATIESNRLIFGVLALLASTDESLPPRRERGGFLYLCLPWNFLWTSRKCASVTCV